MKVEEGKVRVVYVLYWRHIGSVYHMDNSPYAYEDEFVVNDGMKFTVLGITEPKPNDDTKFY